MGRVRNWLVLYLTLLAPGLSTAGQQSGRQKRQIMADQPRLLTENGDLVLQCGHNHNIYLRPSSGGSVFVGQDNLVNITNTVKQNKREIDSLKASPTGIPSNVEGRLSSLETTVNRLQNVPAQLNTLTTDVNTLQNTVTSTNANSRLQVLEAALNNLQPTGQVQSQLVLLASRLSSMETRVTSLETRHQNDVTQLRQQLQERVQTLEQTVQNLQRLLTTNECQSNPCQNGGTCIDSYNGFICRCPRNFKGVTCSVDVNECAEFAGTAQGCQNGATCVNTHGGFSCQCTPDWYGILCNTRSNSCSGGSHEQLCGHGTCVDAPNTPGRANYRCICDNGWTTSGSDPACNTDVDECATGARCSADPPVQCINTPGGYQCGRCPSGYTGDGYGCTDVNECAVNNGGCAQQVDCINTRGSYRCGPCPPGFSGNGVTCTWVGLCGTNNGGCHPLATCVERPGVTGGVTCSCPAGYTGSGLGANGCTAGSSSGACASNPCLHGACTLSGSSYTCSCNPGYTGRNCDADVNECATNPCQNGGTCSNTVGSFTCTCTSDFSGSLCQDSQDACGSYINRQFGSLSYPRVDGTNYTHGLSCAWQITTATDKILMLTFPRFNIEYHRQCNFDFLQIHDGPSASSHMIGKYCGNTPPNGGSINTTHNQVYFWFKTDSSVAGAGFTVNWTSADPVCGGDLSNDTHGTVSSPGYPGNYPHNRDCVWTISVPPGNDIVIHFAFLAMEHHANCSYDFLEIRAGQLSSSPLVQQYCGVADTTPAPLTVLGPYAYVYFHTDGSRNDRGFHITYSAVSSGSGCGGALNGSDGTLTSPNYPSPYDHNAECVWTITVNPADNVQLTFTNFDLETGTSCPFDYLEARDGSEETANSLGRFCGSILPSTITSTGNVMFLKFRSDGSLRGNGFRATWTSGCGGTFTARNGTIQSPSYPNSYPHNKRCNYLISQPEGYTIALTFNTFALEGGSCSYDYVEVRNGGSATSPLLGSRFCGSSVPPIQRSTQNLMYITFRTDGSVSNTGFLATYTASEGGAGGCGGVLSTRQGNITSPGHPNIYPHRARCTWFINVDPGLVIRLTFNSFTLEGGSCSFDSVKVYDNSSAVQSSLMGTYCGRTVPPVLTSTNNYLTIVFRSDGSVARQGFHASYVTLNASLVCGNTRTTSTGVITSPGYPDNYPHGRNCTWEIILPASRQIRLNVTSFSLEQHSGCQFDYLQIRNGGYVTSPLVGTYCGTTIDSPIFSHSNRMWLRFVSDGSLSAPGFRITYDGTATGCGGDLTTPSGSFISPNYPSAYHHAASCFWTVTVSTGSSIQLNFTDFDLEGSAGNCYFDYLEIRENDANGRLVDKLCGRRIPAPVNVTVSRLWFKFRTDGSVSGRGFYVTYTTDCNNVLTAFNGSIESPNFPQPYFVNANCSWLIRASPGNTVNISFSTFDLETHSSCNYDYLELRDGGTASAALLGPGRLCGSTIPSALASTSSQVLVTFVTDSSITGSGFHLDYVTVGCGGHFVGSAGTFTSPNYPNSYDHARTCEWLITAATGQAIRLTIHNFDMENSRNCSFDALEVYMGSDDSGVMLAQLCHTQATAQVLTSTGNTMFVRMRTDMSISGRGFNASWSAVQGGCGGTFSAKNGVIVSKNYPNNYPHRTECEWLISFDVDKPVILSFMDFDLEGGSCSYDYVKLYDGRNTNAPVLATLCGRNMPSPVTYRSSDHYMFIKMRTDGSVSGRGFKANYTSGCGGVRNATTDGEIYSPNYPQSPYPPSTTCNWLIRSPVNTDRVFLTFTHMDVYDQQSCNTSYVQVRQGNTANAPLQGTYCGNTVPATIMSSGSSLFVTFVSSPLTSLSGGFRATYSRSTSSCGGDFRALQGSFLSPGYALYYPANVDCVWTIRASPGNRIQVAFSHFNIEPSSGCTNDYLEARSGNMSGQLLGRWCGTNMPTNLTGTNGIVLRFRTDGFGTGVGFRGTWATVNGGELSGNSGQVSSPGYPGRYNNNLNVAWTITVSSGTRVRLEFQTLSVEGSRRAGTCPYDYVRIRDGGLATSAEIGRYCGTNLPSPVISRSNQVRLEFITDGSVRRNGFLINWQATTERPSILPPGGTTVTSSPGCGGNLIAAPQMQNLTSPGYPSNYSNGLVCLWNIIAPPGHRVWVNITDIRLESHGSCSFDTIRIFDLDPGGRLLGRYCGVTGNPAPLLSSANVLTVKFTTDASVTYRGFNIQYQASCGGQLTDLTGVITSPGYPSSYPALSSCTWIVRATNGRTVRVAFNGTFSIPSSSDCATDYVQLLNGESADSPPLLPNGTSSGTGRYCGSQAPSSVSETSGRFLYVTFVSDATGSGAGFSLFYTEQAVTCGGTLMLTSTVSSGYFTSPDYPNNYPHNVDCTWIITGPANERIQVDFVESFNIERHSRCRFDYVEFRDGATVSSPLIGGPYCGGDLPSSSVSTGNVMYVRFRTDNSVTRVGFKAHYRIATCGGRISGQSGVLTSPNYPSNYAANSDCLWYITGPTGHYLTFTFNAFALEASSSCVNDYVEIREYNETGDVLLPKTCGSTVPQTLDTSDSYAVLSFVSNNNIQTSGFNISFQASVEECGGDLTTGTGTFTSPNFPGQYAHSRSCVWRITVQPGRRVSLTFSHFNLEGSRTCAWDYVEVRNGILRDSPVLDRFCGSNATNVQSSGNTMTVRFRSDGSITGSGFQATYTSDEDATCGGFYTTSPVNISSPGYGSGNYTNSLQCVWQLQNPSRFNSSIKITINDLAIENHHRCVYDFLEFREGSDGTGPILEKFCGNNTLVPPVISPSQQIWVRFRTDRSLVDRGFATTLQFTTCGGTLTSPRGVLASPNYPNNYDHNDACSWLISAPQDQRIRLVVTDFSLENHTFCNYDYLEMFNGGLPDSPSIGKFCGAAGPASFVSQSNNVRVMFVTDHSQSARGFRAVYSFETEACGGLFHNNEGYITSPNFPSNYAANTECVWDINVQNGYIVRLEVNASTFSLQSGDCSRDYVEIMDVYHNGTRSSRGRWCGTSAPPVITSTMHRLMVKFHSDGSTNGAGFSANWTTDCGGLFTDSSGVITSPGYPQTYTNNLRCNYTIVTTPGHYVLLAFDSASYSLEVGGSRCRYDFIEVYGGLNASSPRLGRFCGRSVPEPVHSLSAMHIRFWTDGSRVFSGFRATYRTEACGGVFTDPTGVLRTPTHPHNYAHNSNCTWLVTVNQTNIIALKFTSFDIEAHSRCGFDFVDVFDGNSLSSRRIGRYCGSAMPGLIQTTSNVMMVNFQTDSSVARAGFSAAYWATYGPQHGCGGTLNQTSGQLTSLDIDGDGNYENLLDCYWTVFVGENKLVTVNFTAFSLEGGTNCNFDYVAVYDGMTRDDPLLGAGKYCGNNMPPAMTASTNVVLIVFSTDSNIVSSGFRLTYGQQDALCGGTLTATQAVQNISSPGFPSAFRQAVRCRWTIDSGAGNRQVSLALRNINLSSDNNCSQEYVEFRDSPMGLMGRSVHYCGSSVPSTFYSRGRVVQVNYNIAGSSSSTGFLLSYAWADCNRNFVAGNGRITSPGYPGVYPRNANCTLTVTSPAGTTLALYFTQFYIERHSSCNFDYLEVRNGSGSGDVLARLCGPAIPDPIFIPSNVAYLNFRTDLSVQHVGYDISFTSTDQGLGCGGQLSGINGSLTSPGFPGNYSEAATCTWFISVPARRVVRLTFTDLIVPGAADCANNYVQVFDGPNSSQRTLGRFCQDTPASLTASGRSVTVRLVSTGSSSAPNFRIIYSS